MTLSVSHNIIVKRSHSSLAYWCVQVFIYAQLFFKANNFSNTSILFLFCWHAWNNSPVAWLCFSRQTPPPLLVTVGRGICVDTLCLSSIHFLSLIWVLVSGAAVSAEKSRRPSPQPPPLNQGDTDQYSILLTVNAAPIHLSFLCSLVNNTLGFLTPPLGPVAGPWPRVGTPLSSGWEPRSRTWRC